MEFPSLGAHCSQSSCNKLDFLPMKCDGCRSLFCMEHFAYSAHACAGGRRDVQVPACPLCGAAVPARRGEPPDLAVGAHIDSDCRSGVARQRRGTVFSHKCSQTGCRGRELVPMLCADCGRNHCVRHRHAADHACAGPGAARRARAEEAAVARSLAASSARAVTAADIQGNMTEDEALAHALSLSMQPQQTPEHITTAGDRNSRCILS